MRSFPVLLIAGLILAMPGASSAETILRADCRLVLEEERQHRDAVSLELDLARSELVAAEEVYGLLARLWEDDAVERLRYLTGKHQRDAAAIGVERFEQMLAQQEALIEQYRLICDAANSGSRSDEQRQEIDRAWQRYRRAQCETRVSQLGLAEVDLAYHLEVLASFRDLREHDVATRQDIVYSERDVEMSRKELAQAERLVKNCQEELGEAKTASAEGNNP
jgi:hypothetical protein